MVGQVQIDDDIETSLGEPAFILTPAQAAAFTARSQAWRCISCGKVHRFKVLVPVGHASPCSCGHISFEPFSSPTNVHLALRR